MTHLLRMLVYLFFNDTATTEIYTLSLHDALPIFYRKKYKLLADLHEKTHPFFIDAPTTDDSYDRKKFLKTLLDKILDRKSTRLNSSHANISYAVFCLKKKMPLRSNASNYLSVSCR